MIWASAVNLLSDTYTMVVFLTALFDLKDTLLYIGK